MYWDINSFTEIWLECLSMIMSDISYWQKNVRYNLYKLEIKCVHEIFKSRSWRLPLSALFSLFSFNSNFTPFIRLRGASRVTRQICRSPRASRVIVRVCVHKISQSPATNHQVSTHTNYLWSALLVPIKKSLSCSNNNFYTAPAAGRKAAANTI